MLDPSAKRTDKDVSIWTDLLCLTVNIPGALMWILNKRLKQKISMEPFLFWMLIFLNIHNIILAVGIDQAQFNTTDQGLFGFLRQENLFLCFFLQGVMTGFWGFCGYILATKYFSSLIVMNSLLLEPFIS